MSTTYTRNPGKPIDVGQLQTTMNIDPAITPNCEVINYDVDANELDLTFASTLSAGEETQMDTNITNHTASDYHGNKYQTVADADNTVKVGQFMTAYTSLTAPRTATLPDARRVGINQDYEVKDQALLAATHNVTVDTQFSQTIDGASDVTITVDGGSTIVYSNGTNWFTRY